MKKKTPSQLQRDQRRKKEFIEKKKEIALLKVKSEMETAALITPVDEINLEPNDKARGIFKVKGEYKDPNNKPWLKPKKADHEDKHKLFWELIERNKDKIGIKDFSDVSTYVEHYLEFWGDMPVNAGITK